MKVKCPGCHNSYEVSPQFAGTRMRCNACGATVDIPTQPTVWLHHSWLVWYAVAAVGSICLGLTAIAYMLPRAAPVAHDNKPVTEHRPKQVASPLTSEVAEGTMMNESSSETTSRVLDTAYETVNSFSGEFVRNEVAAELKYDGRVVELQGKIGMIARNKQGLPVILFEGTSPYIVRVFIHRSQLEKLADQFKGRDVILLCKYGYINGFVIDMGDGIFLEKSGEPAFSKSGGFDEP